MEETTPEGAPLVRLQKALADAGVAARRKAETLIAEGRVSVNGKTIKTPGVKVDVTRDDIRVNGTTLPKPTRRWYIALNKPLGVVSTVADRHADKTVVELIDIPGVRLVPAGRLDADSEGLILLSDDGAFVQTVTHPSQSLGKKYLVVVRGTPSPDAVASLTRGLLLEGETRKTAPARVKLLPRMHLLEPGKGTRTLEFILHEGRNRQIRRMLETVGHEVLRLVRVEVGPVSLGTLTPGEWRELTSAEVKQIMAGATPPAAQETEKDTSKKNETRHRSSPRPRPGSDQREAAKKRIQVYKDRLHGGIPPGGQRDIADRVRRQGRRAGPGPDKRRQQDP
jgi:23S rRNA pseudouridine2605 synthase